MQIDINYFKVVVLSESYKKLFNFTRFTTGYTQNMNNQLN